MDWRIEYSQRAFSNLNSIIPVIRAKIKKKIDENLTRSDYKDISLKGYTKIVP